MAVSAFSAQQNGGDVQRDEQGREDSLMHRSSHYQRSKTLPGACCGSRRPSLPLFSWNDKRQGTGRPKRPVDVDQ